MEPAKYVVTFLTLVLCTDCARSANILAIFAYTYSSPYLVITPYIKALLNNGHNVTIISSVEHLSDIEGVRHIRIPDIDQLLKDFMDKYDPDCITNKWKEVSAMATMFDNLSRIILSDPGVRSLIHNKNETFDILLMEPVQCHSLLGLAEHFGAAQVGMTAFSSSWMIDYMSGNSAPSSYRPIWLLGYSEGTSLIDKWNNWIYIAEEWLTDQLIFQPSQQKIYSEYFPYPLTKLSDRRRGFSLILINQHFSLGRVRSNAPNVIEVAGIHLESPSPPIDEELQRFLDEAENGVIYFSLGIEIVNQLLPNNMQGMLLDAFSQLEQRVVWKHEMETIANKSKNIYVRRMVPQRKILEHHNLRLFITHGGLLSIIEAVNSGIPMLGLPMYFDQFGNMKLMQQAGVAKTLDINKMTVDEFTQCIREILQSPSYTLRAKELSERFRDQPMKPLDRAVWWTEYVLRHKGAHHMRLSEEDVPIVSYYNLSFISLLFGRIGLTLLILIIFFFVLGNFVYSVLLRNIYHH